MSDRLQSHLSLVRTLIERAPDQAVRDLETALGGDLSGGALAGVRAMVDAEVADRAARDVVFAPVTPLFGPRPDGVDQLTFPTGALSALWRAVKAAQPDKAAAAAVVALRRPEEGVFPEIFDELCDLAAAGLRARAPEAFATVAERLDKASADGAEQLAMCLDLTRVARPALLRVPEWLQRMTEERSATVRLAFKDAVAIAPDGGARLFEIFFANLPEPWVILRLICAVMVRPVDNYVSSSELAVFGNRMMDDVDRRLDLLRSFDMDGGEAAAAALGVHIRTVGAEIDEFETSLNLRREGPWGARLIKQKAALAKTVEGYLRKADDVVAAALPMAAVRVGGRIVRQAPKLEGGPDEALMRRARSIVTLLGEVRSAAVNGGYNTLRIKAAEELEHRMNSYVEDLLEAIHNGEGDEVTLARLYLDQVADLMGRLHDEKAAQIVRRRAAAA